MRGLKSALFQISQKLYIKFPDIKLLYILTVQINHITM